MVMKLHRRLRNDKVGSYADVYAQLCECDWGYSYCFWMGALDPVSKVLNMTDAKVLSASNGGIRPSSAK